MRVASAVDDGLGDGDLGDEVARVDVLEAVVRACVRWLAGGVRWGEVRWGEVG